MFSCVFSCVWGVFACFGCVWYDDDDEEKEEEEEEEDDDDSRRRDGGETGERTHFTSPFAIVYTVSAERDGGGRERERGRKKEKEKERYIYVKKERTKKQRKEREKKMERKRSERNLRTPRPKQLPQQRIDARLLPRTRRTIKQQMREVSRGHLHTIT